MNDTVDKLYKDYPLLFTKQTSFYLPEGWVDLVRGLCDVISHHIEYAYPKEIGEQIYVSQIKEKFGTLRFYMAHDDDFISGAVTMAEMQSYQLCQKCGKKGTHRNLGGWISTLCNKHLKEETKRIQRK